MSQNNAVSVENIYKTFSLPHEHQNSFKGRLINFKRRGSEVQTVLKDISFDVKKGEFFGIVGKNGSGKSTLLKLLSGIYTPDSGRINVEGKLTPFIELGVGFNPELSGRDNVFLNGALLGFDRKKMLELYDSIVEFAEIERFMDQKLKNYSSGMQVRLAFSIAIRAESDVLILDEVLAVGDAAFQQKCFDYFEELKKNKKTIIFVTHDMSAVRRFCDRAIFLKNGEIVYNGDPAQISDLYLESNINEEVREDQEFDKPIVKILGKKSIMPGDNLALEVKFNQPQSRDTYLGLSVQYNGLVFAEANSKQKLLFKSDSNKIVSNISIDTSGLNSGTYQVGMAVFDKSGELLLFDNSATSFVVKSQPSSVSFGGPMKLNVEWKSSE